MRHVWYERRTVEPLTTWEVLVVGPEISKIQQALLTSALLVCGLRFEVQELDTNPVRVTTIKSLS